MFNDTIKDLLSILGVLISFIGFVIAIWQIIKVKNVAIAAKEAALDAREDLQANILLVDLSSHARVVNEIKDFIMAERYEAGWIRVSDIIAQLVQVRHMPCFSNEESATSFQSYDFPICNS